MGSTHTKITDSKLFSLIHAFIHFTHLSIEKNRTNTTKANTK